jgi:hypothetical protein
MMESVGAVLKAQEIIRATERWSDLSFFLARFLLDDGDTHRAAVCDNRRV